MLSKKDALVLGIAVIGGVGLASMASEGGGGGGAVETQERFGRILGETDTTGDLAQTPYGAPIIYNLPAQPSVTFPAAPTYDLSSLIAPKKTVSSGGGITAISAVPEVPFRETVTGDYDRIYAERMGRSYAAPTAAAAPTPPKKEVVVKKTDYQRLVSEPGTVIITKGGG